MWVGHSTVMINHSNLTVLTDPQFSDYASPFSFIGPRRATPLPFTPAELPIDVVIISHNHFDHLDEYNIKKFANINQVLNLWSLWRVKGFVSGAITLQLDWWQPVELMACVPADSLLLILNVLLLIGIKLYRPVGLLVARFLILFCQYWLFQRLQR